MKLNKKNIIDQFMSTAMPDIEIERQSKISDTMSIYDVKSRASASRPRGALTVNDDCEKRSFRSKNSHQSKQPPHLPLAFIDVNLGAEKGMQKLVIFSEDEPRAIAHAFAHTHGLSDEKAEKLESMLIAKVSEYLYKKRMQLVQ